jgi:hypothetical protein
MKKATKKKSTGKKAKKAKKATVKKAKKTAAKKTAKKTARKTAKKAKKPKTSTKPQPASAAGAQGRVSGGIVAKQPQVKEQAAVAHEMFLYVDDAWAQRYFDQKDLHFLEREVFG